MGVSTKAGSQEPVNTAITPSRADFIALADRVNNIEMRLDDMDAKLDRIESYTKPAMESKPKPRSRQSNRQSKRKTRGAR